MARMARTRPSGVDLHARPGRIPRKAPSEFRSRLFGGGKQAATVRGGTAVAGFLGGIAGFLGGIVVGAGARTEMRHVSM